MYYYVPSIMCEKIKIFTRFSDEFMPAVYEEDRLTIRHLRLPEAIDILLSVIHFPSKNYWNESSHKRLSADYQIRLRM